MFCIVQSNINQKRGFRSLPLMEAFVEKYLQNPNTTTIQALRIVFLTRFENQAAITWTIDSHLRYAISFHHIEQSHSVFVQDKQYFEDAIHCGAIDLNSEKFRIAAMDRHYVEILDQILIQGKPELFEIEHDEILNGWAYKQQTLPNVHSTVQDMQVSTLNTDDDAVLVDKYWKYSKAGTLDFIKYAIQNRPSCGVTVQGNRVTWAIMRQDSAISCLYTLPEYRGHKLAAECVIGLMERFLQFTKGETTMFCYILQGNELSEKLFAKLGFEIIGQVSWITRMKKQ